MGMSASDFQFHVLAVDDNLIDRKLIEKLLKTSSYQVTTVDSGTKALEFLGWHEDGRCNNNSSNQTLVSSNNHHQEVEVNLVITDYCMPGMTGYDLLKKIKESSNLKNIPVVIMSSENVPSRINRCLEEGAEEFFLKPVTPSDVNKLKPHMMKRKCKNDKVQKKPENMEKQESSAEDDEVNVTEASEKKSQSQQQQTTQSNIITTSNNNNNNSKRKSLEEGLSPERTRPRYNNGLTVMSN